MKTIRLYALRENDDSNFKTEWRYRTQFLGSILLWAFRAGATRVEYKPDAEEPFVYTDANGEQVVSEFPQPPDRLRDRMIQFMFLDTVDGHPLLRPFRRFARRWFGRAPRAKLTVPDFQDEIESEWSMVVAEEAAVCELLGTSPCTPRGETK